jgi:phospho-N-acetylmuramoyl-pentapeptide-transferase
MLYYFSAYLNLHVWGPFRLLGSYLVLIGLGAALAALAVGCLLPRLWHILPTDRGRAHAQNSLAAKGKPTGAGFLYVLLLLPVLLLVVPFILPLPEGGWHLDWRMLGIFVCLVLAMVTGYLDDRSFNPWGDYFKGSLDIIVAILTSIVFCQFQPVHCWLPFVKGDFLVPVWLFIPLASLLLWITINATNCSDGVDGLAGSLTMLSLFYLGTFLYVVVGHKEAAAYLLVLHNPEGARWAVLLFTVMGGLVGYLWHNAEPSRVMMGDAGSRFLGLLLGVAVLASGNPFVILVVAPVVLVNGGSGIVKIALLRLFKKMGFDVRVPQKPSPQLTLPGILPPPPPAPGQQTPLVSLLHRVRFPLHDHCRKNLGWSNAQVLLRFMLIQSFLTPLLFVILVKLR